MKNLLALFCLVYSTHSFAQNNDVTVGALAINTSVYSFSKDISESYTPYRPPRGRSCVNGLRIVANVLAIPGGALIGWPLGTAIGGGDPEWYLAGIGVGLVAIAIPLDIVGKRRCERYSMTKTSELPYYAFSGSNTRLSIGGSGNTIGLVLNF
ncbi:MAG TPA: hypothetical protein VIN07_11250 [Flavipsychrobacter sp.]